MICRSRGKDQKFVKDGNFKEIKVRVKNHDSRVVHRLGYFAR
jgi:hypothetical protein